MRTDVTPPDTAPPDAFVPSHGDVEMLQPTSESLASWEQVNPDLYAHYKHLVNQINRLGMFIVDNIDGEPSQSEGTCDCAIRLLRACYLPSNWVDVDD